MSELAMPFWMVLADNSPETRIRHVSVDNARREAKRLALKYPGIRFFVLQAIGQAKTPEPVEWLDYYHGDVDVPF